MTTSNAVLSQFLDMFALSTLNINPICFMNSNNPRYSDFLLKISNLVFMKTNVFKTGIFDHHKMISASMKLHLSRKSPKTKYYRKFDIVYFSLVKENEDCEKLFEFSQFHRVFQYLLNILVLHKIKF